MVKVVAILIGGALGSYCRYAVSGLAFRIVEGTFPIGTFVVNVFGSFLIGLLWGLFEYGNLSTNLRSMIFVGFLGGFTTFSSYMLETLNLVRDGQTRLAIYNLLANNIVGIIMVVAGFVLAKFFANLIK